LRLRPQYSQSLISSTYLYVGICSSITARRTDFRHAPLAAPQLVR
jgi:hypothetical protein